MTSLTTFYLSRLIGCKLFDARENVLGKILDVYVQLPMSNQAAVEKSHRPKIIAFCIKQGKSVRNVSLINVQIVKFNTRYKVQCQSMTDVPNEVLNSTFLLKDTILDKQIVDINGRKLVRVNDVRMVALSSGAFVVAVDVGLEGLLRRIGIFKVIKNILQPFHIKIPSKFILWDDVEAIDFSSLNIKLSTPFTKLNTLHPSDLADIIEDLGKDSKTSVFSALDEETAADVLEELETKEQVHIIESLSIEKAADVLEKMPANEAADLMENLEDDRAAMLLEEMEPEVSDEVRELLQYPDSSVGSIMTTNVLTFNEDQTVGDVLNTIREEKPEMAELYNLFVLDSQRRLVGTFSIRDVLISSPDTPLKNIMNDHPFQVYDYDKLDSISELVSKYNLLGVPVTNDNEELEGMVIIDDVVDDLMDKRRTI
ncbi:MAG: magnesium transporter MgtE N-terminal domain-containing protein [Microbacter sp.]